MILKSFRNASHSFAIKVLFSAIILSFCLWGVGDIIRNYSASKAIFTVGKERVTVSQFLHEYSQEKQRIKNMSAKPLTALEIMKLNIKDVVLDKLISASVLEQAYKKLGIIVPRQSIIDVVHSLPQFQNNGGFDSRVYETVIRRSGMSESDFLNSVKSSVERTQLFHPIMAGYKFPQIVRELIAKDFEAEHTILVARVNLNSVNARKSITDEETQQYYAENKEKYRIPETRDVSILTIDYSKLAGDMAVDENEVEKRYQEDKDLYVQAETREFKRFAFETKNAAQKAWELLNKGKETKGIMKKLLPKIDTIKMATRKDFPEAIGKKLFTIRLGKTSDVFSIGNKFYIYKVMKINQPKQRTKAEIKAEIRTDMQNEMLNSPEFGARMKEFKNKIEDGFGAGKAIEDIARETGMRVTQITSMPRYGYIKLSAIAPDEDTAKDLVEAVFETDEKQASQIVASRETDLKSFVVVVNKINSACIPEYEAIKARVTHDYKVEIANKALNDEMREMTSKGKGGVVELKRKYKTNEYKVSKYDLLTKKNATDIARIAKEIPNTSLIVNLMSTLRPGEVTNAKASDTEYVIIGNGGTETKAQTSPEVAGIVARYCANIVDEVLEQTVSAFRGSMKVKIDKKLISEVTKENDEQDAE